MSDIKLSLPVINNGVVETTPDDSKKSEPVKQNIAPSAYNQYGVPVLYQKGQFLRQHIGKGYRYFSFTPILAKRNDMEYVVDGVPQFNPYAVGANTGSNIGTPGVVPISELEKANTEIENLREQLKKLRG